MVVPARSALALRSAAEQAARGLPALLAEADRVAATLAMGVHGRRRAGPGETFWQYKPYLPGDAAQAVDWRRSARSGTLFVREREWENAQSVLLWRDGSASMDWSSAKSLPTKRDRASLLVLATASLLVRGGERFRLMGTPHPPAGNGPALERAARELVDGTLPARDLPPEEPVPAGAGCVLAGDFLGDMDGILARLRRFAGAQTRGALIQVLDPAEEDFPFDGRVVFEGLEQEAPVLSERADAVREAYRARMAARRAALSDAARRAGWAFVHHRTDRPAAGALLDVWMALSGEGGR